MTFGKGDDLSVVDYRLSVVELIFCCFSVVSLDILLLSASSLSACRKEKLAVQHGCHCWSATTARPLSEAASSSGDRLSNGPQRPPERRRVGDPNSF
jgi:hypothetical protein